MQQDGTWHTEKCDYLERYRITAQAIGLMELLGNMNPNTKQIRIAEKIIVKLALSWKACENISALTRSLIQENT